MVAHRDGAVWGSPHPPEHVLPQLPTSPAPQGEVGYSRREMRGSLLRMGRAVAGIDETHPKDLLFPKRSGKSQGTSPSGVPGRQPNLKRDQKGERKPSKPWGKWRFLSLPQDHHKVGAGGGSLYPPAQARQQQSPPEEIPWEGGRAQGPVRSPIASGNSSKFTPSLHLVPEMFYIESIPGREDSLPKNHELCLLRFWRGRRVVCISNLAGKLEKYRPEKPIPPSPSPPPKYTSLQPRKMLDRHTGGDPCSVAGGWGPLDA